VEPFAWPGALMFAAVLMAVLIYRTPPDVRLYWEYGGRLLGRAYVPGYTDWVQHSIGQPLPLADAVALPARAPYSDFHCEYPPGALLLFGLVRAVADDPTAYGYVFGTAMALMMLATAHLAGRLAFRLGGMTGAPLWAASAAIAVLPLLIGGLLVRRFDVVPAFLAVAGVSLALAGRPGAAGAALGLGGAVKLWPALLVPLIALQLWRRGSRDEALLCVVAGALAILAPHAGAIALGTHPADVLGYLAYLRDRPVQIESVIGIAKVIAAAIGGEPLTISHDFGSDNILWAGDRAWLRAATVVNVFALLGTALLLWVRSREGATQTASLRLLLAASGAVVAAMALCSRVFSGEYLIWFLPFALALAGQRFGLTALVAFVASCAALRTSYHFWDALVAFRWSGVLPCAVKNLCLAITGIAFAAMLTGGDEARLRRRRDGSAEACFPGEAAHITVAGEKSDVKRDGASCVRDVRALPY